MDPSKLLSRSGPWGLALALWVAVAPGLGAQDSWKSIVATTAWVDAGSQAASGVGFEADVSAVRSQSAVSGGATYFSAPWAQVTLGRVRLDQQVAANAWIHIGAGGGSTRIPPESLSVRRFTVGVLWTQGTRQLESRFHNVNVGASPTSTVEVVATQLLASSQVALLLGNTWGDSGAYAGLQTRSTRGRLEILAGGVMGALRVSDAELAQPSAGNRELYLGFMLPIATHSSRLLGVVWKYRTGPGGSRTLVQLLAKLPLQ